MPGDPSSRNTGQSGGCLQLFGLLLVLGGAALALYTWRLSHGFRPGNDIAFRFVMSAVIAGVGIVLNVLGSLGGRAEKSARILAAGHPDQPWFWREDWAQGSMQPESAQQAATLGAVSAILLLLSAPLVLQLREELVDRGNYLALAGLVFPITGLLLGGQVVLSRIRQRKFAGLRLTLAGVPAALGRRMVGQIEGEFQMPAGTEVELVLSCVRSYVSGSGSNRPRWQQVLWQDKARGTALAGGARMTAIPVDLTIPYDARETDFRNADDEILWRLTAAAAVPGLDFRCEFRIPVFNTANCDPEVTIAALEAKSQACSEGMKPADSEIVSGPSLSGGVRFHLPAARQKAAAATTTVVGLLFLASGLFFGYGLGRALWWFVGAIPVVLFGGLGLLLLTISFGLSFGATTVEVINGELHTRSTVPGVFPFQHPAQG